jgi:hypothetical protein
MIEAVSTSEMPVDIYYTVLHRCPLKISVTKHVWWPGLNVTYSFLNASLNLNSVNQLIFVMVKCGVLFEVRTEFLNNI